jgi:hypothetical protein
MATTYGSEFSADITMHPWKGAYYEKEERKIKINKRKKKIEPGAVNWEFSVGHWINNTAAACITQWGCSTKRKREITKRKKKMLHNVNVKWKREIKEPLVCEPFFPFLLDFFRIGGFDLFLRDQVP